MYRRVRFRRTPGQLGLPPEDWTAERSRRAWLDWLRAATRHFDATGEVPAPPKKPEDARRPRSKARFVPKRDDAEYPKSPLGGAGGLDQMREYQRSLADLHGQEERLLEDLRRVARTTAEYKEYSRMWSAACGPKLTLEDRRFAVRLAGEVVACATKVREARRYASASGEVGKMLRRLLALRREVRTQDDLSKFGGAVDDLLGLARTTTGAILPPSYRGWEGPPRYRWSKMYRGVRLRVTCAELGLPREQWNSGDSYEAWQAWLRSAEREIDGTPDRSRSQPRPAPDE